MEATNQKVIADVRRALGRTSAPTSPPVPPRIDPAIARLVSSAENLAERFAENAMAAKLLVETVPQDGLVAKVIDLLKSDGRSRIGIADSSILQQLKLAEALAASGLEVKTWPQISLDEAYELDCGITDIYAAIAETGSLVIRPEVPHGRALSLIPPLHIAIVPRQLIVADLLDLMAKIESEPIFPNYTIITGPSKTADIEGILFTGVHGPGVVKVFLM